MLVSTDMPVQYVAAAVLVGIIIGVALTLLGFFLRNRFLNVHPRYDFMRYEVNIFSVQLIIPFTK